jgi:cholesterol transport system auxiliary component
MTPSRRLQAALAALSAGLLAIVLAGCDLKLPGEGPPPRLFALSPKTTFDTNLPKVDWQLVVEPVMSPSSLDTVRIAIHKTPLELQYYARAQWTDRVPAMLQTLLVESFENTGKILAVGREAVDLRADFSLKTEIRHFEVEYSPEGVASPHVRLVARLIKMPDRTIIGDHSCDYQTPAESDTLDKVVEAYNEVVGRCMRRIVEWTLVTGNAHRPQS